MLTKYTETELLTELRLEIEALLARREPVHPGWLTHKVCKVHKGGLAEQAGEEDLVESDHVAFWRYCGYAHTRKLATMAINEWEPEADTSDEHDPFLPGYKFIRPQYVNRVDGVDVMIPTEQMSVVQLYAKATLFERNSGSLAEHARELRRYAAGREHERAS